MRDAFNAILLGRTVKKLHKTQAEVEDLQGKLKQAVDALLEIRSVARQYNNTLKQGKVESDFNSIFNTTTKTLEKCKENK